MPFDDDDLSAWDNPHDTPEIADLWGNGDDEGIVWEFDFSDDNGALAGWDDNTLEALLSDLSDIAGNADLSDILADTPL